MRIPWAGRVGIAMILGGVVLYAGMKYWAESRNFDPVNVPISLRNGASVRHEFSVNVSGHYWVDILRPEQPQTYEAYRDESQQTFRWEIRDSSGKKIDTYSWNAQADGSVRGNSLGYTSLRRGRYTVSVFVITGSEVPTSNQPRLTIGTDRSDAETLYLYAQWIAVILCASGLLLFIRRARLDRFEQAEEEKAFGTPPAGNYQSNVVWKRTREKKIIAAVPLWGPFGASIVFLLLIPTFMLINVETPKQGVWVNILTSPRRATAHPAILVRVVSLERTPQYSLNGSFLPIETLRAELTRELARQPDWTVYVDGDPECSYAEIMAAVDNIRAVHAKPILVTPSTQLLLSAPQETAPKK